MSRDFSKTLIRSSSLSCLYTEPKAKADKDAGKLSKTAQTHLIEVYARELWGVEKDLVTKQMRKGIEGEESGITLLSIVDGKIYTKNDERKENEWISGHADIIDDGCVIDLKLSWDAFTFLPKLIEGVCDEYYAQLQAYMYLWELDKARLVYGLVDTPESIIQGERYRLLRNMNVVSEESPEYLRACKRLESSMRFGHIPANQRIISHDVVRDEEFIKKIPEKVEKAREFLNEIHKIHFNFVPDNIVEVTFNGENTTNNLP